MIGLVLLLAVVALVLHLFAVCLCSALRTYSRSRLEELGDSRGLGERVERISHEDQRTDRAGEALASLSGIVLAASLAIALLGIREPEVRSWSLVIVPILFGCAHALAGIFGRVYAEEVLIGVWPLTGILRGVTAPLTGLIHEIEKLAYRRSSRLTAGPRPASVEVEFEPDQDDGSAASVIDLPESTREMMERVIELTRRDVHELMTPRSAMRALPATVTATEAARAFAESGFSRIPLYGENRDDIIGILYAKDLYARMIVAKSDVTRTVVPRKLARNPLFVPESKNAAELLNEFQTRRVQLGIVLDEYGGVAGLITLEDLLEELVGEIVDEHDIPSPEDPIKKLGESTFEVDATLPIEDLNEKLGLRLPTDEDFSTIGGLAFSTLGHLPEPGVRFRRDGIEFTVLHIAGRSIRRLLIDLDPSETVNSP